MSLLPGYVQTPFGGWVKDTGTGPYTVVPDTGDEEGASVATYRPLPSGFWTKDDGSGPYFYDVVTGEAVEVPGLFRSLT